MSNSLRSLSELQCKYDTLEDRYIQLQYDAQKFKEEARVAHCQKELAVEALEKAKKEIEQLRLNKHSTDGGVFFNNEPQDRNTAAIASLQSSTREAQLRVVELEAQLSKLKDTMPEQDNYETSSIVELNAFLRNLSSRLGISESAAENLDYLFYEINDRLDRAALRDVRRNESDISSKEMQLQLNEARASASDLASRLEGLLSEKDQLKKRISLLVAENADLLATKSLLNQRIDAQGRQIDEFKMQLSSAKGNAERSRIEIQQATFDRNTHAVQLTSLVESLAASLSTFENPCPPTEVGVREAITRATTELKQFRQTGNELDSRVSSLQRQFELQFTNGLSLSEELKGVKRELQEANSEKQRLQTELEGFRHCRSAGGEQIYTTRQIESNLVSLCDRLLLLPPCRKSNDPLDLIALLGAQMDELIQKGCLNLECLRGMDKQVCQMSAEPLGQHQRGEHGKCRVHPPSSEQLSTRTEHKQNSCPSCDQMRVSAFDLARSAPNWKATEETVVKELCHCCIQCLALALRSRLGAALADFEELRIQSAVSARQANPDEQPRLQALIASEQQHKKQLEAAQEEIEALHSRIRDIEEEKTNEAENLEKMANKLEKLRQQQAKKIIGLQNRTEQHRLAEQQQENQLKAAKSMILGTRQKQIRLLDFRNTLARMLNVDTWLIPNPESIIVQQIQSLICSSRIALQMQAQRTPVWNFPMQQQQPSVFNPSATLNFPALSYCAYPEQKSTPLPGIEYPSGVYIDELGSTGAATIRRTPSVNELNKSSPACGKPVQVVSSRTGPHKTAMSRAKSASALNRDKKKY